MQIHEITKKQLQEGIFDAFKTPEKIAAQAAAKLQAQGYGQPKPLPPVQDSVAAVQKNPAQQQYINGLVSQWKQAAPDASTARPKVQTPAGTRPKTSATDPNWRQDALKSAGATFAQAPAQRPAPGQMPASVAASAQGQRMMQAYGKPRGGVQGIKEAPAEYTTPSGVIVPGGTKTDQAAGAPAATPVDSNKYKETFLTWAAEKLRTKDPVTRQTITLDQVNATDIKDELDRALTQVVATAGDPAKNAIAVNNYLTIAVAGVARKSQELRQDSAYNKVSRSGETTGGTAGQAIVTQQEIQNKLSQEVGLSNAQIQQLKQLGQDPAARAALLKSFGMQT